MTSNDMPVDQQSEYQIPVIGYEVLEERNRFTIFRIQIVHQISNQKWLVFRRYADFIRLNKKLQVQFPGLQFSLPPKKKWFGNNFDPAFLEDRQSGLQIFINNLIAHPKIKNNEEVKEFFCLNSPPDEQTSLEETRIFCHNLGQSVVEMREQMKQKDEQIHFLQSKVDILLNQQETLLKALRLECRAKRKNGDETTASLTHNINLSLLDLCEATLNKCRNNINSDQNTTLKSQLGGLGKNFAVPLSCALSRSQSEECLNSYTIQNQTKF